MTHFVHANGASIPAIGFGTWNITGPEGVAMVERALQQGYRHIDTAQAYRNEEAVGEALRNVQLPREDIFLTTKVWYEQINEKDFGPSVEKSLEKLGVDQVDLLLLHWPDVNGSIEKQVELLDGAIEKGWTKHIGVSNYTTSMIDTAVKTASNKIVCNQVEYHPLLDQTKVYNACRLNGMAMTAYSPIGQGSLLGEPVITEIARAVEREPSQVVLRWHFQQEGVVAIPRTSNPDHLQSNIDIFDFELTPQDMGRISKLQERNQRIIDPSFAPDWDEPQTLAAE